MNDKYITFSLRILNHFLSNDIQFYFIVISNNVICTKIVTNN